MHRSKLHRYSITSSAMSEQLRRDCQTERLGGLEVDDELEFGRLLTGRSAGLSPLRIRPA